MPDKNKIILGTNDDTYIAADDAGNIVLQHEQGQRVALTDSAIEPATDETLDLGSATNKFKDLYLSSDSIYIGNTKLSSDPTTGALSTVVADEQGQFTAPAAPVGGGEASAFDWEGEGYTYLHANLLARTDASAETIKTAGAINYWDPIETYNYSVNNPSVMPFANHAYTQKPFGGANYRDLYLTSPDLGANWQMGHIGGQSSSSVTQGMHDVKLWSEAEADLASGSSGPKTLFKDSDGKYFYDFLQESFKKYQTDSFFLDMVFEVTYTCSNATTAAATPFFQAVTPDPDGVYRRTFIKIFMKDIYVTPMSFYSSTVLTNGLQDYRLSSIKAQQFDTNLRTRQGWSNGYVSWDEFGGMGMPVWSPYNDTLNTDGFIFPYYGEGGALDGPGESAHCHHDPYVNFQNTALDFTVSLGDMSWGPSFFENGTDLFNDPGQITGNAGRGCERTFKVKIKQ